MFSNLEGRKLFCKRKWYTAVWSCVVKSNLCTQIVTHKLHTNYTQIAHIRKLSLCLRIISCAFVTFWGKLHLKLHQCYLVSSIVCHLSLSLSIPLQGYISHWFNNGSVSALFLPRLSVYSLYLVPAGSCGLSQFLCSSPPVSSGLHILSPPEPTIGRVSGNPPEHTKPPHLQQAGQRHAKEWEVHPHGVQGGLVHYFKYISKWFIDSKGF